MRYVRFILILIAIIAINTDKVSSQTKKINVLVFSKTNGYRHEAIPSAVKALVELGTERNWQVTTTEDSSLFTDNFLAHFDAVVFLLTTGDILNNEEQEAFKRFIESGKGFVGVHSATDTEYDWPWYDSLVGTNFLGHPPVQEARVVVEDTNHPATSMFREKSIKMTDEWYSFKSNPRKKVHVLMSLDESSYNTTYNPWFKGVKLPMGDHPIVWYHYYDGGRAIYTGFGHVPEMYAKDSLYRAHLAGAIEWAAGKVHEKPVTK